ncbi:hypothetical protein [Kitasatospora sp. NPDC096204]|uniref:hypothetical protein n=1 Tax=Kitasatospora sp. NPDC096204 TaxID=3364094 RepID=UPI0037FDBCCC
MERLADLAMTGAGAGRGACVGPHAINDRFLLVGDSARSGGLSKVRKAVDTAIATVTGSSR